MIFLLVAGALIVGAPILAAILVAIASLREDAERSLVGRPPGKVAAAARRLLSVRTESTRAAGSVPATGQANIDMADPVLADPVLADPVLANCAPTGPERPGFERTGAALARVPAPRLADRERADDILPIP
jgi:hypothetical protein